MATLIPFFIVLFAGLFFSEIFHRFHFPWVIALIAAGVIVGPQGLQLFTPNETILFIGQIGLVFLMFMAGLETKFSYFRQLGGKLFLLALFFGGIPFITGFFIAWIFNYSLTTAFFLGIVFTSSSISVIIPTLEQTGLMKSRLGKATVSAAIVVDIASLVFLSMLLHRIDPVTTLPLPLYYGIMVIALFALRFVIVRIQGWMRALGGIEKAEEGLFQDDLRIVFALLIGTVIVFQFFGLHPIAAGFFSGLVLSEVVQSNGMRRKLQAIGYGLFIPTFFVILGAQLDMSVFFSPGSALTLTLVVVLGSMISKFIGGVLGGKIAGFTFAESAFIGVAGTPQLSVTVAVALTGAAAGMVDAPLIGALVVLGSITAFTGPMLIKILATRHEEVVSKATQEVKHLVHATRGWR